MVSLIPHSVTFKWKCNSFTWEKIDLKIASTKWWQFCLDLNLLRESLYNDMLNFITLWWCHNERNGVSNHQPHDCLLKRLFRCRSKKTSKLHITGLCEGNPMVTDEFPAQRASNAENASIWWLHHDVPTLLEHSSDIQENVSALDRSEEDLDQCYM